MITIPFEGDALGAWASPTGLGLCLPRRLLHFDQRGQQRDWDVPPSRSGDAPFYPAALLGREPLFWSHQSDHFLAFTKSGGPWQLLAGDRPPPGFYRLVKGGGFTQLQGEHAAFTLDRGTLRLASSIPGAAGSGLILNPWTGPRAEGPEGVLELVGRSLHFTPAPPPPPGAKELDFARGDGLEIRVRGREQANKRWQVQFFTAEGPYVMTCTLRQVDRKDPSDNSTRVYPPGEWIPALARWEFPQPLPLQDGHCRHCEGEDLGGDLACATTLTWSFDPATRTGTWEAFLDFC